MEIEYSKEGKGIQYAFRFTPWEQKQISEALKPIVIKLEKQIVKVQNHPNNDGQVKYSEKIRELRNEIVSLTEIIKTFDE